MRGKAAFVQTEKTKVGIALAKQLCEAGRHVDAMTLLRNLDPNCLVDEGDAADILALQLRHGAVEDMASLADRLRNLDQVVLALMRMGVDIPEDLAVKVVDPRLRMAATCSVDIPSASGICTIITRWSWHVFRRRATRPRKRGVVPDAEFRCGDGKGARRRSRGDGRHLRRGGAWGEQILEGLLAHFPQFEVRGRLLLGEREAALRAAREPFARYCVTEWLVAHGYYAEALEKGHDPVDVARNAHDKGDTAALRRAILAGLEPPAEQESVDVLTGARRRVPAIDERLLLAPLAHLHGFHDLLDELLKRLPEHSRLRALVSIGRYDEAASLESVPLIEDLSAADRSAREFAARALWGRRVDHGWYRELEQAEQLLETFRGTQAGGGKNARRR